MVVIPANLSNISSLKDGSIKLIFETNELHPADISILFSCRNKLGYLAFKPELFDTMQLDTLKGLKCDFDGEKSPAKRFRNVLFLIWKQNNEGYEDFNLFYINKMEIFIEKLKSKLL
jgi:hypothetical protein